jgi:DNA-binding LytR/AlgR family response regulator
VKHKFNLWVRLLNEKLRLFLSISFGIFLFILFFQPFQPDRFDFNNRLLFVAGFGVIIFFLMVLILTVHSFLVGGNAPHEQDDIQPSFLIHFILLTFNSVAFVFYLRYVGSAPVSFYTVFKVILICLAPPSAIILSDRIRHLKLQNEHLLKEKKTLQKQIANCEEDNLNKTIEFASENNNDKLNLKVTDVGFIRSADNYVEIVYKEDENFRKKLLRNSLKNMEQQLKPYMSFVRCHRTCIVNTLMTEKLNKSFGNYSLTISGYPEQIPVSRQYLLILREAL